MKRAAELGRDPHTRAGHRTRITEACAGAIVAAGACPLRDLRLHDRPYGCPVLPARIEHDRGRAGSRAIEIQPSSVRPNQRSRPRVDLVAWGGVCRAVNPEEQATPNQWKKRLHGELTSKYASSISRGRWPWRLGRPCCKAYSGILVSTVALTRAVQTLTIVHREPLPPALVGP